MKNRYLLFGILFFSALILTFPLSLKASSNKNPVFATIEDIAQMISKALLSINLRITNHESRITTLESQVSTLTTRVNNLEIALTPKPTPSPTSTPTPTPSPTPIPNLVFVSNGSSPFNNSNPVDIPNGFKTLTFSINFNGSAAGWAPEVSFDGGSTWHEEQRFSCSGNTCSTQTVPILGNKYIFSLGSSNISGLNVVAIPNVESSATVNFLGQNVSYPFDSNTFDTTGFSTIIISVGSGDNPQHLTGISLQRLENGNFVEKQHLNCDGGATCPYQSLPVLGGNYRVEIQGNGTNGEVGAILRP